MPEKVTTIPLFLIEEHHEAFLAWNFSVMNGVISAEDSTLLHVDEHADLEFPALDTPMRKAVSALEDLVSFTYSELGIASFLYDIDLDFFSCDNRRGEDWEIEITQAAYEAVRRDRYHPLRLASGNLVKVREQNGSYYLCSNFGALAETNLVVDEKTIVERIDAFVEFLRRNSIQPALIDIARSRLSRYTPAGQTGYA